MPCIHVGNAIVCMPNRYCKCGRRMTRECDFKVTTKKSGTCDKALCDRCTHHPSVNGVVQDDKDLCPKHRAEWERRQSAKRSEASENGRSHSPKVAEPGGPSGSDGQLHFKLNEGPTP